MSKVTFLNEDALFLPIEDASVDLIITSPPYFGVDTVRYGGDPRKQINHVSDEDSFLESLVLATKEMYRVLKNNSAMVININTPTCFSYCHLITRQTEFKYFGNVVWDLSEDYTKKTEFLHKTHEIWMVFYKGERIPINNFVAKKHLGMIFRSKFNNMDIPEEQELNKLGRVGDAFSIEIADHFIKLFSKKRGTVLDPFGGSGVTALCAARNDRFAITNDISKEASDLAKKRLWIYEGII